MADNKKEQERAELHRIIWNIANDLRGSVDGWDFKQYVLGVLFYRYISENLTAYVKEQEDVDYATMPDKLANTAKKQLVDEKGFFIPPSELFCNVCKNADTDDGIYYSGIWQELGLKESKAAEDWARRIVLA